ncbi:hypothetical protein CMT22_17900 [Elizabethkingia anophelis]|nr:hypothetical protein [Elizabethkingia anophelis]
MTSFSFEIEHSEADKIKAILKALGVKKLKVKDDETEMSKEEFEKKLDNAKSGKGTVLRTNKEVSDFFASV